MQHPLTRRPAVGALCVAALSGALALAGATVAQAASTQTMDERGCPLREVVIASQTTGRTTHGADGKSWDKGEKTNSGATTYTGQQYVVRASVHATTSIYSAGTRCP